MTDPTGDATVPPPAIPDSNDPHHQIYAFTSTDWDLPPVPKDIDWFGKEERTIRDAHAYAYQQFGTTYHWARYVHLGYFAYVNCTEFDKIWTKLDQDPLSIHRAIWYNFMYHVERDMPMTEQLNAWTLNISHDFLEYYDVKFLTIDTLKHPNGVRSAIDNSNPNEPDEQTWIPVPDKKKQQNKQTSPADDTPAKSGGILRDPDTTNQTKQRHNSKHLVKPIHLINTTTVKNKSTRTQDRTTHRE